MADKPDNTEDKLRKLIRDTFQDLTAEKEKAEKEKNDPEFRIISKIREGIREELKAILDSGEKPAETDEAKPAGTTIADLFGLGAKKE